MDSDFQSTADVIVVGAGIIGLTTAWELQKKGLSVLVLDKGQAGREASWAGGGILSPLGPWRYPENIQKLSAESQALYPGFCEEIYELSGIDPEFVQSGLLVLGDDEARLGQQWAEGRNVVHEILSPADLNHRCPHLHHSESAILLPEVAQVRNPRLLAALLASLDRKNVEIQSNCPVRRLLIEEGNKVIGVSTVKGDCYAPHVVLASGAWTPELIPRQFERPDIEPVKGQMLLFRADEKLLDCIVLKGERYLIPRKDGRILAGSSVEDDGFNKSPTVTVKEEIKAFATELLPSLNDCQLEAHWTGLRPGCESGPQIDAHSELRHLWVNAGHSRYGLTQALSSAKLMVNKIL